MFKRSCALALVMILAASGVQAHVLSVEEVDSSFEAPFQVTDPMNSKSITAFLAPGDIDVFEMELEPAMKPIMDYTTFPPTIIGWEPIMIPLQYPLLDENNNMIMEFDPNAGRPVPVLVTVTNEWGAPVMWPMAAAAAEATRPMSPLITPAGCDEMSNFYPSIAVIGPGMPPAPAELPFSEQYLRAGPEGVWVKYAVKGERKLFTVEAEELNNAIIRMNNEDGCNIPLLDDSMDSTSILPVGLRQDCLMCGPSAGCDMNAVPSFFPIYAGTYQFVVFAVENSRPGNYSLALGEQENFTCEEMQRSRDIMEGTATGELLFGECTPIGHSDFTGCDR